MNCIRCQTDLDNFEGPCPKCGWDPDDKLGHMAGYGQDELVKGRYEVQESLGVGRLGSVLLALDKKLGIEVALKVIHPALLPTVEMQDEFIAGARSLIGVKHENMATVFDAGRDDRGRCFFSREFLDGSPLAGFMENRRIRGCAFPLDEALSIVDKIAQLSSETPIGVHGSLSPQKIWIMRDRLKIADAGIASLLPPAALWHCLRSAVRSRGYAAPEIERDGAIDPRTDVFSVGALVGEMLMQVAFDGNVQLFVQSDPDLPPDIGLILKKALSRNLKDRYLSLRDLANALRDVLEKTPVKARLPFDGASADYPFPVGKAGETPRSVPPKFSGPPDAANLSGDTAQVLMEEVIRSHGNAEQLEDEFIELKDEFIEREAEFSEPTPQQPRGNDAAHALPPNRPTDLAGLARIQKKPKDKAAPPPVPRKHVEFDTQRTPAPALRSPLPSGQKKLLIEPKRPISVPRDSRPPSYVVPPSMSKADDPPEKVEEPTAPSPRRMHGGKTPSKKGRTSDRTQEVDISDLAEIEDMSYSSESTRELDIGMIEVLKVDASGEAANKLEKQAVEAERESANELIRRASRLDGVDPRLVRAAHKLESDRRGDHSRQAAQILRERAEHLEDIDPRLLRAAARLEEARVREASVKTVDDPDKNETEPENETPEAVENDDWRERLSQTSDEAVISFLAPASAERTADVRGFPKIQNRDSRLKSVRPTPASSPPPPSPKRR